MLWGSLQGRGPPGTADLAGDTAVHLLCPLPSPRRLHWVDLPQEKVVLGRLHPAQRRGTICFLLGPRLWTGVIWLGIVKGLDERGLGWVLLQSLDTVCRKSPWPLK